MKFQSGEAAVFTIVHNEKYYLPLLLKHYSKFFNPEDIYVLDHDTTDGSTDNIDAQVEKLHNELYFSHQWLVDNVQRKQEELLKRYRYVLFVECDELVIVNPDKYIDLCDYIRKATQPLHRCSGFEIIQTAAEPIFDPTKPIFDQRRHWCPSVGFNKPLLARVPMHWAFGFHTGIYEGGPAVKDMDPPDPDLLLVHLHYLDYDYYLERHKWKAAQKWKDDGICGYHNRWDPSECIAHYTQLRDGAQVVPEIYTGGIL